MRKANTMRCMKLFLVTMVVFLSLGRIALADVSPREVIDKSNWQKAQGLVPDQLLDFIKKGDWILNVVNKLNFNTNRQTGFWIPHALEAFKTNLGRYDLDKNNLIIDVKTGKHPKFILGFPFPEIDPKDPKAAAKIMYNKEYMVYQLGYKHNSTIFSWIGRSGFERDVEIIFHDAYLTGYPGAEKLLNPDGIERYTIISVVRPYDLAGTSVMLWRYLSLTRDLNFSYVPAIRRVRRTSPASRSDAFVGSDFCVDDTIAYDGKIADFEWKLVGKQEGLIPFHSTEPLRVLRNEKGEIRVVDKEITPVRYGYQEKGWAGAPWCPVSLVYAKRPVWVIEAKPKDPYYNYGTQYIWVDIEGNIPIYKLVYDRAGKFWKFVMMNVVGYQSDDKKIKFFGASDHIAVDVIRQHATCIGLLNPGREMTFFKDLDLNDFTLAGFQKYCK